MDKQIAVFGGGCFWCTEAVFKMIKGVSEVMPGYSEGIEVARVEYDPQQVDYKDLLTIFFGSHDPTSLDRQGADIGLAYRSAIFYTTEEQKEKALDFINEINLSHPEGRRVVTEVAPLEKFKEAEDYHNNYFEKNREAPYCQIVINPKLQKVQKNFSNLLKKL